MIVIDIEARALARHRDFQPGYGRRTPQDKPGRPWRRENDGPRPDRLEQSRVALERLTKPKPSAAEADHPKPKARAKKDAPHNEHNAAQIERTRQRTVRFLQAVADGARTNAAVAVVLGESQDETRFICEKSVKRGLLAKGDLTIVGKLRVVPLKLTDAGRAFLEANQ